MKKYYNYFIEICRLFLYTFILSSCTDQYLITEDDSYIEINEDSCRIVIDLNEGKDSRIAFSEGIYSIKSTWEEGDAFNIITSGSRKYTFTLQEGAGTAKGTFVCRNTPPKSSSYLVYYPVSITNNTEFNEKISLRNQVQNGDGSTAHLAERLTMQHIVGHYSDIRFIDSDYTTNYFDKNKGEYVEVSTKASNFLKSTLIKIEASNIPVDFQPTSLELYVFDSKITTFRDTNKTTTTDAGQSDRASLQLLNFDKDKDITAYMVQSNRDIVFPEGSGIRLTITNDEGISYYSDKYFDKRDTIPGGKLLTLRYNDGWKLGNNYKYVSNDFSADGQVVTLQTANVENGINIVFIGDGFSDRQIANQTYDNVMKQGCEAFFAIEPFKTFRHYFNVYYVIAVSAQEGCTYTATEYSPNNTALKTYFGEGTEVGGDNDIVTQYTFNVPHLNKDNYDSSMSVVLLNSITESGTCYMMNLNKVGGDYGQGFSIAYAPIGCTQKRLTYITNHEANGHGFGKLCDEYVGNNVPSNLNDFHPKGWGLNVDDTNNLSEIIWSEFCKEPYLSKEGIGAYLGANYYDWMYYRPTYNSIMRTYYKKGGDIFNAPSRKAIYVRIHKLVYGEEWTWEDHKDEFFEWDVKFGMPNEPSTPGDEIMDSRLYNHNDMKNVMLKLPPSPPVIINSQIP